MSAVIVCQLNFKHLFKTFFNPTIENIYRRILNITVLRIALK